MRARSRSVAVSVALAGAALGCAAKSPADACPKGSARVDGVCASEEVADYVACVRAQSARAARLGEERSRALSREAGAAGARAKAAAEVRERLERSYAAEAGALDVIRACDDRRGPPGKRAACIEAGKLGAACGFEADPAWASRCDAGPVVGCLMMRGPTCENIAFCGFEEATRATCGAPATPAGTAGCVATLACYSACKGDAACECRCTAAMAPSSALAVGLVSQCYEAACRGCEARGRGECGLCFRQRCQAKVEAVCEGR